MFSLHLFSVPYFDCTLFYLLCFRIPSLFMFFVCRRRRNGEKRSYPLEKTPLPHRIPQECRNVAPRAATKFRTRARRSAGIIGARRDSANTQGARSFLRGTPACASRTAVVGDALTLVATRGRAIVFSVRRTGAGRGVRWPGAGRLPSGDRTCAQLTGAESDVRCFGLLRRVPEERDKRSVVPLLLC